MYNTFKTISKIVNETKLWWIKYTCIKSRAIPFSLRSLQMSFWLCIMNKCYSRQGIVVDNINGKEIPVIDTWLETNMARKYTWLKYLSQVLRKGNISCMRVHAGISLNVGEKSNTFRSVTFQNIVQNSCNAGHVMHLQVDLPWNLESVR
jgi:hypothetical protein